MAQKIRIIIADDHPLFLQGLLHVLNKVENYNIVGNAADGKEALQLISECSPDIAVLDVQMPKLDGFEVARAVVRQQLPVKIIFLTMFKEKEFVRKVFDMGIKGYVLKENAVTEIVNSIEAVMEDKFYISPQVSDILFNKSIQSSVNTLGKLTATETRILKLIGKAKTSREISEELFISVKTVENHRSNICKKLGITGNSALLKYALKNLSNGS